MDLIGLTNHFGTPPYITILTLSFVVLKLRDYCLCSEGGGSMKIILRTLVLAADVSLDKKYLMF